MTATTASTTGSQLEHHGRPLPSWERPQSLDDWFDATMAMQRSYLQWVESTVRLWAPQLPVHHHN